SECLADGIEPLPPVRVDQRFLATTKFSVPLVGLGHFLQRALNADEFGPRRMGRVARFVEEIGVPESGDIAVEVSEDRGQKGGGRRVHASPELGVRSPSDCNSSTRTSPSEFGTIRERVVTKRP